MSVWILDSGAIDTMTYDPLDIVTPVPTKKTHIQTADGNLVAIKSGMSLNNCLLIPKLSHSCFLLVT